MTDEDDKRWREIFASLIEDEPPSSVTPMTVLAEAKHARPPASHARGRRVRLGIAIVAAAAAVAGLSVLGVTLANQGQTTAGSAAADTSAAGGFEAAEGAPAVSPGSGGLASTPPGGRSGAGQAGAGTAGQAGAGTAGQPGGAGTARPSAVGTVRSTGPVRPAIPLAPSSHPQAKPAPVSPGPSTVGATAPGGSGMSAGPCRWPGLPAAELAAVKAAAPPGQFGSAKPQIAPCLPGRIGGAIFPSTDPAGPVLAVSVRTAKSAACATPADGSVPCVPGADGAYLGTEIGPLTEVYVYGGGIEVRVVSDKGVPGAPDAAAVTAIARAVLAAER